MVEDRLKMVYEERDEDAHKFHFGHLLVIGGSKKYTGAPALVSLAAYRAGADLVTTVSPRRAADVVAGFSPNLITVPLEGEYLKEEHLEKIREINNYSAVVIGNGLGRKKETTMAILKFLKKLEKPCLIDADAIHAVTQYKKVLREDFIITPHLKEFEKLTGKDVIGTPVKKRKNIVRNAASDLGTNILLKGNPDVISNGQKTAINKTGNPYMTVGGTGDVLAGIAGYLLARGTDSFEAAKTAAYINGKTGDLVARTKKESLLATDIINNIYRVF